MSPKPACVLKKTLADELRKAMLKLIELNDRDVKAILADDWPSSASVEVDIQEARKARDAAAKAYRDHMAEHGC